MTFLPFLSAFNWYGFLIGSGMVICIVIAYFLSVKRGYYGDLVFDIVIICIPMAIIGARLYYVIFDTIAGGHWTFLDIIGLGDQKGLAGLAIYGGLIGAVLGGLLVALLQRRRKEGQRVTFIQMADLAFTVIILGQAIGRWGNFANHEAYGEVITNPAFQWFPIAVNINGVYHMATFFYESLWDAIGFGLLLWFYNGKRKSFDGFVFASYLVWYGFGRFFIEGLRTDSLWLVPNVIRVSQLLSGILFFVGLIWIFAHVYRARTLGLKPFIFVPVDKLDNTYYGYEKSQLSKPPMENNTRKKKKKRNVEDDGDETFEGEVDGEMRPEPDGATDASAERDGAATETDAQTETSAQTDKDVRESDGENDKETGETI